MSVSHKIFQIIIVTLLVVSFSTNAYSQPSYSVDFTFRLFNEQGKPIDYETFCRDYKLLGVGHRSDQTPCTNEYMRKDSFYNDSTNEFQGGGTIVYNDLVREFIHNKDTMLLILSTNGGDNQSFYVDSLIFKPGKYYIKEKTLNQVDFKNAEVNYYNFVLEWAISLKKTLANYRNTPTWTELKILKKEYNISNDDFEPKTVAQIFK